MKEHTNQGFLSVNYQGLIAPLIEAFKAQHDISLLKEENQKIKADGLSRGWITRAQCAILVRHQSLVNSLSILFRVLI